MLKFSALNQTAGSTHFRLGLTYVDCIYFCYKCKIPGPKSHEISLMILHQIFQKIFWRSTSEGASLSRLRSFEDLNKIFIKLFGRSQRDFLEILEWSSFKILLRSSTDFKKNLNEDLQEIFFRNLIEIWWRSWEHLPSIWKNLK